MSVAISIIIPTLNEEAQVTQAIDRARQSSADEWLIVDGGSTDGTVSIARSLGCKVVNCAQTGRGAQQNAGARAAGGDVFVFLHADTWLEAAAIEQLRAATAARRAEAGAFRQHIESDRGIFRLLERGNTLRARRLGLPYGDQGIFISRDLFFRLGCFPEVALMEDLMLMRRVRRHTRPVVLPGPIHVSARRWIQHGPIRQTLRNWTLLAAYACGACPSRLARYYDAARGSKPQQ